MMPPVISIVIPVYNGSAFIQETIDSIKNQTFSNFEVIFVDDSSTDDSLEILNRCSLEDPRFRVFQKENGGTAARAVNFGLRYALGEYFMYSSQDDIYSNDLLKSNYTKAKELNADAVVPNMVLYYGNKKYGAATCGINGDTSRVINGREALVLSLDWTIHGFVFWKTDTVKRIGFYEFGINSDEFTTRVFYFNSKRVAFSEGIFFYRQNNNNAITKKWDLRQLECFNTSNKLEEFLILNKFTDSEVALANRIILIDLIRIQIMIDNNVKIMSPEEAFNASAEMKKIYKTHQSKIKALPNASFKLSIIQNLVSLNYFSFRLFTKFYRKYLHLLNGR